MGTQRRLLRIIEAAYEPADTFGAWARHVTGAMSGLLSSPQPAIASLHRRAGETWAVDACHTASPNDELSSLLVEMTTIGTPEEARRLWSGLDGVATASEALGEGHHTSRTWSTAARSKVRMEDALGLYFERDDGRMVTFNLLFERTRTLSPRARTNLARVVSHLSLSERLLRGSKDTTAVLGSDGKVVHAEGDAKLPGARSALRAQALRMDRARSRGLADEDAVALWRGMVDGRWSLVDEFDTDGKRFFVARENIGPLAGSRALSTRERQVLALVRAGRTNKLIAYELGIDASTVSLCVRSILDKTGLRDRAALVELAETLKA